MLIDEVHYRLGWPSPEQIWAPPGSGPAVFARLAREKIGAAIKRLPEGKEARVGILAENPSSEATEAPLAIVCDFQQRVSHETLREVQKLAWNFCRSPLLVTIESEVVRAWTCWERPADRTERSLVLLDPVAEIRYDPINKALLPSHVADMLHWVRLVSGDFIDKNRHRFRREQRADQVLLSNLEFVRGSLVELGLKDDIVHDLLARLIFVQFLQQRTDSSGTPALNYELLLSLQAQGVLSRSCKNLGSILEDKSDTYRLFHWLNERFNGDLFPGKGATEADREREWRAEMDLVDERHLRILAEFVRGDLQMGNGQRCLWPLYSFDAIPLEFISSIYEEFVSKGSGAIGAHYTPGFMVDFILDRVLPWGGAEWDLRILDPSCGSGIFLVKSFQRLVHRWRQRNGGMEPGSAVLQSLLENNLFGVDVNPHAIRVASFSLYLAMCDEIDPRRYWTEVSFPRLRNISLIHSDFFEEEFGLISTRDSAGSFDLVIGNAPWGKASLTEIALKWATTHEWPVINKQIGALFVAKAAVLVVDGGRVAMLQPAGAILFNRSPTANGFRRRLFNRFKVDEIVDLSALRLVLFPNSAAPSCLLTLVNVEPDGEPITYCHPTPGNIPETESRLVIEPYDVHCISVEEAMGDPWIWTVLAWGSRRDLALIRRLCSGAVVTLGDLRGRPRWKGREGYKRGDRAKPKKHLADGSYALVTADDIDAFRVSAGVQINYDDAFHSRDSTDDEVFLGPLLLVTKAWRVSDGFRAALFEDNAIFPASSVYGLHFPVEERALANAACAVLNSHFAEWFLSLTSGRAASYRPEVLADELLRLPVGVSEDVMTFFGDEIESARDSDLHCDNLAKNLLKIREVEWVLIEDFVRITLRDFRQPAKCVGRLHPTRSELREYCDYFMRVLRAGFGEGKVISATIFELPKGESFSICLVAFHFDFVGEEDVVEAILSEADLIDLLESKDRSFIAGQGESGGSIFYQRVARVYDEYEVPLLDGRQRVIPSVFFVKPNQIRYWSRSAALRDADSVAVDILDAKEGIVERGGVLEYLM